MLQKVFNMFVEIPENIAINIPGLRDPSSLPHLKKVRQKIKSQLKFSRAQLKYKQEKSKKLENCSISNDILKVSQTDIKRVNNVSKNIFEESINPTSLNENYSLIYSDPHSFSNLECEINKLNQKTNKTHVQSTFTIKTPVSTITSTNISSENNVEIVYKKSDISFRDSPLKPSINALSPQIANKSM